MANTSKNSEPGSITKADVTSNVDSQKSVGLTNGILRLTYYESILQDSIKAFVVNRVADFAFIIGLCLIYIYIGSFDFNEVFVKDAFSNKNIISSSNI